MRESLLPDQALAREWALRLEEEWELVSARALEPASASA
jgi:hypothetical protein